jgi:para-nitrobenzyl esterase
VVLPLHPVTAFDAGDFHHVPVIVGANRDEGRLFVALADNVSLSGAPPPKNLTDAKWAAAVDDYFGPRVGPEVQQEYPLDAYPDAGTDLGEAIGDALLACPAVSSAETLARFVPIDEYEFDHVPDPFVLPTPGIVLGAFHSAELPYVFDGPVASSGMLRFTVAQQTLATEIDGAWTRFAATGDPAGAGVSWPTLSSSRTYLSLNTPSTLATGVKSQVCAFWASTR